MAELAKEGVNSFIDESISATFGENWTGCSKESITRVLKGFTITNAKQPWTIVLIFQPKLDKSTRMYEKEFQLEYSPNLDYAHSHAARL